MSTRRELTAAVLLCLLGALLVLLATGSPWARVDVAATGLAPARTVAVDGSDVQPGARALALVGLAGVVAVAATRRSGRTAVGVVLIGVGLGTVAAVIGADSAPALVARVAEGGGQAGAVVRSTGWPAVGAVGGALVAVGGAVVAVRGRRWAALSARYDTPAARAEAPTADEDLSGPKRERTLWEALDRGEDPTGAGLRPPIP